MGYGEGGVLTEAVRRKPYSVVLLDEVEKAHPDVHEMFFQVFDKGYMEDGEGRSIDFKNTLILLTTNAGTELIAEPLQGPRADARSRGHGQGFARAAAEDLPAGLAGPPGCDSLLPAVRRNAGQIVRLQLNRIKKRVEARYKIPFEYSDEVVKLVVSRCTESESGGRMIDAILTNTMLPDISRQFLTQMMEGHPILGVKVGVDAGQFRYEF